MFAFAIWDSRRQRLLMARDRVGIKPLYYHAGKRRLAFASEIKALLEDDQVPREIDEEAMDLYLSLRYVPGDLTAFADIHKLLPGHQAVYENGQLSIRRYWQTTFPETLDSRPAEELSEELWARLQQITDDHLLADVPVGVFLSGGLDSSAITAQMVEARRRQGGQAVKSFAVGYRTSDGSSELDQARQVATALGTQHREVLVTARDFVDFLPKLAYHLDEPVADAACVPLYYLSKRAREESDRGPLR